MPRGRRQHADHAMTRDASDPRQVRRAAQLEKDRGERYDAALGAVLSTPAGRLVWWELLVKAGVYKSIWDPSAKIHYNAGRQDFGHELLADAVRFPSLYLAMEQEGRHRQADEEIAATSAQAPAARELEEGETDGSE